MKRIRKLLGIDKLTSGPGGRDKGYIWGPIHYHFQNLTQWQKPLWRSGRCWLSFGRWMHRLEWHIFSRSSSFSLELTTGGDDDHLQIGLCLPYLLKIWITFNNPLLRRLPRAEWWGGYVTGIAVHGGYINIHIWYDEGIYKPTGRHWMLNVPDMIFGRAKYSELDIFTAEGNLKLPERAYPVTVRMFESTWKRPRWPWPTRIIRADVDAGEKGIPAHAGKGENSWDLEDDFTYSMTVAASSPAEAVEKYTIRILLDRKKYGPPDFSKTEVT